MALGSAARAIHGHAAPETLRVYSRARSPRRDGVRKGADGGALRPVLGHFRSRRLLGRAAGSGPPRTTPSITRSSSTTRPSRRRSMLTSWSWMKVTLWSGRADTLRRLTSREAPLPSSCERRAWRSHAIPANGQLEPARVVRMPAARRRTTAVGSRTATNASVSKRTGRSRSVAGAPVS